MTYKDRLSTPIGEIQITATDIAVVSVCFVLKSVNSNSGLGLKANSITDAAALQLAEYFAGIRHTFELPLAAEGTEFQQAVWAQLRNIEFGKTCSYQDVADALDNSKAVRAVGAANSRNPISIIVPCHRVIGANGTLTGYAGGLDRKAWLLKHEGLLLR